MIITAVEKSPGLIGLLNTFPWNVLINLVDYLVPISVLAFLENKYPIYSCMSSIGS